jgi:hypothetical protein
MLRGLRILAGIVCVALFPVAASAQASITGTVKDASGAVLPGVTVEAASPALIEMVRTATSDGSGQYRIENLRPGAYTVTFTLPGFSTVKREGIELTGTFVATVNADLKVGTLEETITVTGETPTVDVQSVARQRVMTSETMEQLPVNRMAAFIASLIPGVNNSSVDVGGSLGPIVTGGGMTVHGSRSTDLLTMSNGLSLQSIQTGSAVQGVANMAQYQEVAIDTAAADASQSLGGVRMNLIPAEGGNQIHGSFTGAFANSSMQGSNYDADLRARGLPTPNGIKRNWDINPAVGGPLRQNKLWFFTTGRYTGAWNYAGIFGNANAGNANSWTYAPNNEREATELNSRAMMGRVTWQAMQKQKFNIGYDYTGVCQCNQVTPTLSSEAASNIWYDPKHVVTVDWTSPMTNRLLLDGSFLYLNLYRIADPAGSEPLIQVNEQSTNLTYRARSSDNRNISIQWQYRGSLSYITGAHSFKTGFNNMTASSSMFTYLISPPLTYRFNNGVPNQFTEYALPSTADSNIDADLGLFAQDKWTHGRMTLSGGLRFDYFKTSFPETRLGPTLYAPNRNVVTPDTPGLHWKDITPRTGFAYDVFGNGKTAVKASLNKYVAGQALRGSGGTVAFGSALTPTNLLVTSASRSWVDSNRNFIVDCDLTNQAAQDRAASGGDVCGAGNVLFGQNRPSAAYDPEILGGWGHRGYNWETSVGVQQELRPRISVDVSYFRRWFGNFAVTDNLAVAAADFTPFTIKAPTDSRLPGGGGYPITAVNVVPAKFNVTDNYITFAKNFGKQIEHWNGVDVNFNVRPQAGTLLQGGLSTGRLTTDNCEVVAKLPEMTLGQQTLQVTNAATNVVPAQFCHEEEPFLTQIKLLGSYLVPKIEVQISGTLQSLPGQQIAANYVAPNAEVAPSLGRPLSGGAANVTVAILEPGSMYGDRRNQLDLRIAKVLRLSQVRTTLGIDIANATNANPVLTQNPAYAVWLRPQTILTARFVRFSAQINF